jgi:hypothetical protein
VSGDWPVPFLKRGTVFVTSRFGRGVNQDTPMPPKVYRSYAAECLRCAMKTADADTRSAMRRMAIAWSDLAEQAERNQRNDTVFETPERDRREG